MERDYLGLFKNIFKNMDKWLIKSFAKIPLKIAL